MLSSVSNNYMNTSFRRKREVLDETSPLAHSDRSTGEEKKGESRANALLRRS